MEENVIVEEAEQHSRFEGVKMTAAVALLLYLSGITFDILIPLEVAVIYVLFKLIFIAFSRKVAIGLTVIFIISIFATSGVPHGGYVVLAVPIAVIVRLVYLAVKKNLSTIQINGLAKAGVFTLLFAVTFVTLKADNKVARSRAETLIAACNSYKQDNGEYPKKLEDLVPEYIDKVPTSKYSFGFNKYHYKSNDKFTTLWYVDVPPFGRPHYYFDRGEWGYLD